MVGRKKVYTTEILQGIVDKFFNEQRVFGQVTATDISKYAVEKLGFKDIRYYHFTRDKEIEKLLHDINHTYNSGATSDNHTLIEFNPERFMETYRGNEKVQKVVLRQFADRHSELNQKVLDLLYAESEYKKQIENLQAENKKLKEINNKLKASNESKSNEIKKLNRLKVFEEQCNMREFLHSKSLFNQLDDENLSILLNKCGFIQKENLDTKSSEIENSFDCYNIDKIEEEKEDIIEENEAGNKKIVNLNEKKEEKEKKVSSLLSEVDDLL